MADELLEAELIDEDELDPTDLAAVFFRKVKLSEEQKAEVIADLDELVRESLTSRGDLDEMLAHWNDMAEGIAKPKNFPWPDSSNLFIPIAETKLNDIHSAARQTMLKADQIAYVRSIGIKSDFSLGQKLERFMNFKCQVELPLIDRFSQLTWCAERDGTVIAQVQWMENKGPVREIKTYTTAAEFTAAHPTPQDAGMSTVQYGRVLSKLSAGTAVRLVETREDILFKGPVVSVVQLSDFLWAPINVIRLEFARWAGKIFTMGKSQLKSQEKVSGWDVEQVINSGEAGRKDLITSLKDDIEGISRRARQGEFVLVDGIHNYDLDGDGIEEKYLAVYHPQTKTLVDYLHYPYLHGKDCLVPCRLKKRPNRFLGRSICQMIDDINSEINTQHNQRIDSRTITTVPSFKARNSAKGKFDPTRKDQRFVPGRVFWLDSLDDIQQFDIRPTDLSESVQEESNLMQVGDSLVGSSQLRSGRETKSDPRAPAAKVSILLNQSNVRLDDYFEELAGSAADNEGFNAILEQILMLYYQFFDADLAEIPAFSPTGQPEIDPATGQPVTASVSQEDLNIRNRFKIQMAKTSASMNPDALYLKYLQIYSLLINDPLVGGRPAGRLALDKKLLSLAREENPDQFLPKDEAEASQAMGIAAMLAQVQQGGGSNNGAGARTRNGVTEPATPAAGGSTRPLG